jgi:Flp pilus assembly protein TadD
MTKGGVDHEADIAAAKRRLEALTLKRQSDPGRRKQARDTNGKGLEYIRAGQWSEAVQAFQAAYTADPTDIEIINNLGYAHLRHGNAPAAEPVLLRALIFAPGRSSAWANLGETYAKQGNLQAAVACFANAYRFSGNQDTTRTFLQTLSEDQDDKVRTAARQALQLQLVQAERQQLDEERRRREEYQKLQAEQERLRQERERLQGGGAPKGPQVAVGGNPPAPATPQTLRTSIGRESAPPAVTVELSSPTPEVTFQPQQRFQEVPGKQVKITASKKGYVTAEKTILVADHDMSEVLGPLPRQAELEQGELERRKRQAEDTERRRREAEQAAIEHQRQAEDTERRRREAKQAEQQQRENILVAQGMKFIVKRQFLCLNTQDNLVVGTTTLTGASSLSCEDAGRALMAEYEKKKDCSSPSQKEGQKQWIGTASCPAP